MTLAQFADKIAGNRTVVLVLMAIAPATLHTSAINSIFVSKSFSNIKFTGIIHTYIVKNAEEIKHITGFYYQL